MHTAVQPFQNSLNLRSGLAGISAGQFLLDDPLAAATHDSGIIDYCRIRCKQVKTACYNNDYTNHDHKYLFQQLLDQRHVFVRGGQVHLGEQALGFFRLARGLGLHGLVARGQVGHARLLDVGP